MTVNYTFMGVRDGAIGFSTDLVGSLIGLACTAAQVPYRMCTSEHRWDDICNDFWSNGENISHQLQYMLGGEEFLERIKNETHPAYRHAYNGTLLGSNLLSMAPLATSMALKAPKYLKTGYSVLRNWRTHMVLAKQTCQQTPAFIKYALGLGKKVADRGGARGSNGFLGRRGWELKNPSYQPIRNNPVIIGNRKYSAHAVDQMQNRGYMPSLIEHIVGTRTGGPNKVPGRIQYYDPNIRLKVITEADGEIVTIFTGRK